MIDSKLDLPEIRRKQPRTREGQIWNDIVFAPPKETFRIRFHSPEDFRAIVGTPPSGSGLKIIGELTDQKGNFFVWLRKTH